GSPANSSKFLRGPTNTISAWGKRCLAAASSTLVTATSAPRVTRESTNTRRGSPEMGRGRRTRWYRATSQAGSAFSDTWATACENSRAYTSHSLGSKRSARPSTRIPNSACPPGSSTSAGGNSAGGRPARHRSSSSRARSLHEVLVNQYPQLLARGRGNHLAVREDGVGKRRAALAAAGHRHAGHRLGHHMARVLGVLHEVGDDFVHRHGVVAGVPAVVVRHHGHRRVADLGLARQLGFLEVGHADHVHPPTPVHVG